MGRESFAVLLFGRRGREGSIRVVSRDFGTSSRSCARGQDILRIYRSCSKDFVMKCPLLSSNAPRTCADRLSGVRGADPGRAVKEGACLDHHSGAGMAGPFEARSQAPLQPPFPRGRTVRQRPRSSPQQARSERIPRHIGPGAAEEAELPTGSRAARESWAAPRLPGKQSTGGFDMLRSRQLSTHGSRAESLPFLGGGRHRSPRRGRRIAAHRPIQGVHVSLAEPPLDEITDFEGAQGPTMPRFRQSDPVPASVWLASGGEGAGNLSGRAFFRALSPRVIGGQDCPL